MNTRVIGEYVAYFDSPINSRCRKVAAVRTEADDVYGLLARFMVVEFARVRGDGLMNK